MLARPVQRLYACCSVFLTGTCRMSPCCALPQALHHDADRLQLREVRCQPGPRQLLAADLTGVHIDPVQLQHALCHVQACHVQAASRAIHRGLRSEKSTYATSLWHSMPFVATASAALVVAQALKALSFPSTEFTLRFQMEILFIGPEASVGVLTRADPNCECVVHRRLIEKISSERRRQALSDLASYARSDGTGNSPGTTGATHPTHGAAEMAGAARPHLMK